MLPIRSINRALIYRQHNPTIVYSRYLSAKKSSVLDGVVIASAVRTPIADFNALNATQLGALAIEAAWKQAAVQRDQIQRVYMCTSKHDQPEGPNQKLEPNNWQWQEHTDEATKAAAKQAGLLKAKCNTMQNDSVSTLKSAMHDLHSQRAKFVIAGVMESVCNARAKLITLKKQQEKSSKIIDPTSNKTAYETLQYTTQELVNYHSESFVRTAMAVQNGVLDSEIVPVHMKQDRQMLVKHTDEVQLEKISAKRECLDGAAALMLTMESTAKEHGIKPLARILDYEGVASKEYYVQLAPIQAVEHILTRTEMNVEDIDRWEVHAWTPAITLAFADALSIDRQKLNLHGVSESLAKPFSLAGICLVTHLAHTLEPGQKGCAVVSNDVGLTSAILLEKLPLLRSGDLPLLTLFTKKECPLCDELVAEIDGVFPGEFRLEKVFIDDASNSKFQRLYRNDIPVLFLNGQFVCMHKLNIGLIRNKLKLLAEANMEKEDK